MYQDMENLPPFFISVDPLSTNMDGPELTIVAPRVADFQ